MDGLWCMKKKSKAWKRFTDTPGYQSYVEFKVRNKVTTELRKAKRKFEKLAEGIKKDSKSFYRYAKSKVGTKEKIGPLKDEDWGWALCLAAARRIKYNIILINFAIYIFNFFVKISLDLPSMFRIMEDITKMCVGFLLSFFLASKVAKLILSVDYLCTKNVIRYSRAQLFALRRSRDRVYIDQLAALGLLKLRGCQAGFNKHFRRLPIQPCLHESSIANGIPTLIGRRLICCNKFGSGSAS